MDVIKLGLAFLKLNHIIYKYERNTLLIEHTYYQLISSTYSEAYINVHCCHITRMVPNN